MDKNNRKIKTRNLIIFILAIIILSIIGINLKANYLEIKEIGIGYTDVFFTNLRYQYSMFAIIFLFIFILFCVNTKIIKKGLKKFFDEDKKTMPKLPNKSINVIFALIGGLIGEIFLNEKYKLFINNAYFGVEDKIFGKDIGYYLFIIPFVKNVILFLIGIFVFLLVYTAVYYILTLNTYLDGVELETLKKNTFIKQLITFSMIIVILIAGLIWIGSTDILSQTMLEINDETNTELIGASTADVTVKVWGYRLLSILIVIDVIIIFTFIKKENAKKVIITAAVIPIYLLIMFGVLMYVKNIYMGSSEFDKEKKFISYNIENTKKAYGIEIEQIELDDYDTITYSEVLENQTLINNIPLIDEKNLETAISEHQENNAYYSYDNTNLSLFNWKQKKELMYITPRQINLDGVRSYNSKTFEYTHGYSAVLSSINKFDKSGYIEYLNLDITEENENISQPRIYFGTGNNEIIVTNSKFGNEFDYSINTKVFEENTYLGKAGQKLGFFDRLILGLKNKNLGIAFSKYINKNSNIITNKNIIQRAKKILPDIIYDENPYMVISSEGKLVWALDGYTVANNYPYSQETLITVNGEKQKINYIRNSVKVLIDSYDGTTKFYITDKYDPIITIYKNMYSNLFVEQVDEKIKEQFLYPKYLYNIQANIIKIYHNITEDSLYRGDDVWNITNKTTGKNSEIDSYYTAVRTIDNKDYDLGLVVPFNRVGKQNMVAYLVGKYEEGKQKISLYKFKSDSNVAGIIKLNNQIEQDETISAQLNTINTTGTKLIKNIIIVPINNTLLYVEPVYQIMLNDKSQTPVLRKVIVASGNKVAIGDNMLDAINNLYTDHSVEITTTDNEDMESIIDEIIKANKNLDDSMKANNFELMGKDIESLKELINQLEVLKEERDKEKEENIIPVDETKQTNTIKINKE